MTDRSDFPTPADPEHALWNLIEDLRFAMLTTRDAEGRLRGRPMTTQNPHPDEREPRPRRLWFFLSLSSEAAEDVRRDAQVHLAYASPDKDRYVSVTGSASSMTASASTPCGRPPLRPGSPTVRTTPMSACSR